MYVLVKKEKTQIQLVLYIQNITVSAWNHDKTVTRYLVSFFGNKSLKPVVRLTLCIPVPATFRVSYSYAWPVPPAHPSQFEAQVRCTSYLM